MAIRDHFDLVIFDWAGTMVDFGCHAPVIALRECFARRSVHVSDAQLRHDMGKAKEDHVRALLRDTDIAGQWVTRHARSADESDVADMMKDLGPLMREQATLAARLIEGASATVDCLRAAGVKIASSTGYTREMMLPVLREAARQGYAPDHVLCAGETVLGRPSPLMIYKACVDLAVWPLSRVVKVDDTEAGVAEGRAAGCFTVGISASGNAVGLSQQALRALSDAERRRRVDTAEASLLAAGADVVIESVADLLAILQQPTPQETP